MCPYYVIVILLFNHWFKVVPNSFWWFRFALVNLFLKHAIVQLFIIEAQLCFQVLLVRERSKKGLLCVEGLVYFNSNVWFLEFYQQIKWKGYNFSIERLILLFWFAEVTKALAQPSLLLVLLDHANNWAFLSQLRG